jgi:hypothetical protein
MGVFPYSKLAKIERWPPLNTYPFLLDRFGVEKIMHYLVLYY